eukprot:3940375-Rhodomonas_salina.1
MLSQYWTSCSTYGRMLSQYRILLRIVPDIAQYPSTGHHVAHRVGCYTRRPDGRRVQHLDLRS